jgi:GH25 family lysozyme M1 (1,4-beta-N-acetylmuramidase)
MIAATCTEAGYTVYTCDNCNSSYIADPAEPIKHDLEAVVLTPTCDSAGYTTYSCKNCTLSYNADDTLPLGHSISSSVTAPTCTEQGFTSYSCENCDFAYNSDFVNPTGHTYTSQVISVVSCTEAGEVKYICSCGDTYSVITSPTGHDFAKEVTMPTLSDMGYTEYVCNNKDCGFTYTGDLRFYTDILPNGAYSGNSIPTYRGIDISKHNYTVDADNNYISLDWNAIKAAGIDYAIIKAGSSLRENYTLGGIDPTFEISYRDAKAAEIGVGVYFYTYATNVDEIIQDAYLLLSALDGKQFEYPIYLDLEDPSLSNIDAETLTQMCVEFFTVLQRAGYYTGLYVNNEWLYNKIQTEQALSRFEIWYARYPTDNTAQWDTDAYGAHLGMWQYTDNGSIEGIEDIPFDFNVSYKNYPEIIKNGGFNGYGENIKFVDSDKKFVWIKSSAIKVRSSSLFFTEDSYDPNTDIIGYAHKGARFEIVEESDDYIKIIYNGKFAYISANTEYISFESPYIMQTDDLE